jgi:hypothetical protein
MSDLGWQPPSPEGAQHPDEILTQFGRATAFLTDAFERNDRLVFDEALKTAQVIFAAVWEQAYGH